MILSNYGLNVHENPGQPLNRGNVLNSNYYDLIFEVYNQLGGQLSEAPLNISNWDLKVEGIVVELDEELHFNRYRKKTLHSPIYNELPCFPKEEYRNYCLTKEEACLAAGSYGKKWTSTSCENQFGASEEAGTLSGNGSARWKQRAFYDFVKDLSPLILNLRFARISIWDIINVNGNNHTINDILENHINEAAEGLFELKMKRSNLYKLEKKNNKWIIVGSGEGWIFNRTFPRKWKAEIALKVFQEGGKVSDYWKECRKSGPKRK